MLNCDYRKMMPVDLFSLDGWLEAGRLKIEALKFSTQVLILSYICLVEYRRKIS